MTEEEDEYNEVVESAHELLDSELHDSYFLTVGSQPADGEGLLEMSTGTKTEIMTPEDMRNTHYTMLQAHFDFVAANCGIPPNQLASILLENCGSGERVDG